MITKSTMFVDLKECTIKSFNQEDAECLAYYANNKNIWSRLRDSFPYPYTLEDARKFISTNVNSEVETDFAICIDNRCIGSIGYRRGMDVHSHSAEVGYWIGEPFWGRGICTEALKYFSDFLFSEICLKRLFAYVFENNIASSKVLLKNDYHLEGILKKAVLKDSKYLNVYIFSKLNV